MIYIFIFFITSLIFLIATFFENNNLKIIGFPLQIINIIILTLFAGLRAFSVGTDVLYYMVPSFQYASLYANFNEYWKVYHFEPLYAFLSYKISIFSGQNSTLFLTILACIIIVFIFMYLKNERKYIDINFAFYLFLWGFFNISLNYTRQLIALSISIYSLTYLLKNKEVKFTIGIIIASLFHYSALLLLILLLFKKADTFKKNSLIVLDTTVSLICLVILLTYNNIISKLIDLGIISSKYSAHLSSGIQIQWTYLLFHIVLLAILFYLIFHFVNERKEKIFMFNICLFDGLLSLVSILSDTSYRIELNIFIVISLYIIPRIIYEIEDRNIKLEIEILILSLFIMYWIITVLMDNEGETIPYVFAITGRIFN